MTEQTLKAIQRMAKLVLSCLAKVSEAAERQLPNTPRAKGIAELRGELSDVAADPGAIAVINENRRRQEIMLANVSKEPFHVYVRATCEDSGEARDYFVMRHGVRPDGLPVGCLLCSYLSPAGRIAEVAIGDSVPLPNGEEIVAAEKNLFTPTPPKLKGGEWDGTANHFQMANAEEFIPSLREFLDGITPPIPADVPAPPEPDMAEAIAEIERQIAKKKEEANRRRRAIISSGELRDQPILDSSQGGIFRMPLNSSVAVTGAPGTGKTTLLIKRLAQKTNMGYLSADERELVNPDNPEHQKLFHAQNWTLFVPSEGLRDYLKEAMSREMIPATNATVQVWKNMSKRIALEKFGYIGAEGYFKFRERKEILSAYSSAEIAKCAGEFNDWHEAEIAALLQKAKQQAEKADITTPLLSRLQDMASTDAMGILRQAEGLRGDIRKRGERMRELSGILTNAALSGVPGVVGKVADIFPKNEPDTPEDDGEELDGAEAAALERESEMLRAKNKVRQTIMRRARGEMGKGKAGERSQKLWAVIEPALARYEESIMPELSELAVERKVFGALTRGFRNCLNDIPRYYQRFRLHKLRQQEPGFFHSSIDAEKTVGNREISADEVDIVNFIMMRNADNLAGLKQVKGNPIVDALAGMHKTQIAADEATDFSAVQLACMYYLANPMFRSFTMVGDLMQRMTQRGIRNFSECEMFAPGLAQRAVKKSYRQSRRLTELAVKLYGEFIGEEAPFASAYKETQKGPDLLLHFAAGNEVMAEWIADRVVEIHSAYDKFPSIAVFVANEGQAREMATMLGEALESKGAALDARACPDGIMTAADEGVHVIPVQFVKGLEFEGVFFAGLDDNNIAREQDLIERYLYVGVTRAAQFLAVICRNEFPERLACVRDHFNEGGDWSE